MIECIRGSLVLKYSEFKKGLENGEKFSVYLIEGEDAYFRERALKMLSETFVSEPEINSASFDGTSFNLYELLSSLSALPFMSRKRLTVIREFYPKADVLKKDLKSFFDAPPEETLFAIVNEKPSEPLKKFKSVCVVDCGKASVALLVKWIKARCAKDNVFIENSTAETLAEYCLSDMTRIENETEKLIAFAGNGGTISREDVDGFVSRSAEYKIYEMTDCVGKKQFGKALDIISDLTEKGETPQRIIVSVYNYFRRLLHVAIADAEVSELAAMFNIKEFAVKKAKEQAAMFKKRSLKSAVDMLADADFKIKSGKIDAEEQMWLAVFSIMTDRKEWKK